MTTYNVAGTTANHKLLGKRQADIITTEKDTHEREHLCSDLLSKRWTVAYMGLYLGVMSFVYRVNISITMPFMVRSHTPLTQSTAASIDNGTYLRYNMSILTNQSSELPEKVNDVCPEISQSLSVSMNAEFIWSKQTQYFVLSSFYYGYLIQSAFGLIAGKYGGKNIISICMAMSSVLMLVFPVLARSSVYAVIVLRVLLGLCLGAAAPAWVTLISKWALPHERSRFTALGWCGQYMGTVIGYFTSGFLCANGFDNGWGSVFYVHGIMGVLFVVLWLYLVYESPADHPRITRVELNLLTSHAIGVATKRKKELSVPWRQMLTYKPVLAMFTCHFLECYMFYMVLTCLPLYMKAVLRFDIQSNGIFSSLPFICSAASLCISGILADTLISRHCLSTTTTRKVFQTIGFIGTSVFILVTGFLSCDQRMWVIVFLCLCMCFDGIGQGPGLTCIPVDIAPRYASVIFGISKTCATIAGIIAPIIVAELTPNDTAEEWRTAFCIAAGCGTLASIIFGLFSSSEPAPWAMDTSVELEVYSEAPGHVIVKSFLHQSENINN